MRQLDANGSVSWLLDACIASEFRNINWSLISTDTTTAYHQLKLYIIEVAFNSTWAAACISVWHTLL
jgi:hypothetical protein